MSDPVRKQAATAPSLDIRVRDVCAAAETVETVEQFKHWVRHEVRHVLPHGALACGHGRLSATGLTMDYLLTVDYPVDHLRPRPGQADCIEMPLLRRWQITESPLLFDVAHPWADMSADWIAQFRDHDLHNAAVHGCYDEVRRIGTYFSFHRLPPPLGQLQRAILIGMTPLLHDTLMRVIGRIASEADECTLTPDGGRVIDITQKISTVPTPRQVCEGRHGVGAIRFL